MTKFDVNIINPFIDSAKEIIFSMAGFEAKLKQLFVKKSTIMSGEVSGVVGMTGESFSGTLAITFSTPLIFSIIEKMVGELYDDINRPEVKDAVGEITNIIFGHAKKRLNEKNIFLQKAIPTVISGVNHSIDYFTNQTILVVPFETEKGPFSLEIAWEG